MDVKKRITYFTLALVTLMLGLATRSGHSALPELIVLYGGDTLWAMLVYWLGRFIRPSFPLVWTAAIALGFSFFIESLQLYHAPWIDAIRQTRLGGLVLGFGFLISDLICYSVGVIFGYLLDSCVQGFYKNGTDK